MFSTGQILVLPPKLPPPAMGIARPWEGGARGREGALGTDGDMGTDGVAGGWKGIFKHVQRQAVHIQSILRCRRLIRVFHSCLLQSAVRFLFPNLT